MNSLEVVEERRVEACRPVWSLMVFKGEDSCVGGKKCVEFVSGGGGFQWIGCGV